MHIAMSNALTQGWHDFRLFLSDLTISGAIWLLIGYFSATMALSALAIEATLALHAPHRRQLRGRWIPEVAKSTMSELPVEDLLK